MYNTLLLIHRIFVSLFLFHYLIKLILLLTGKNEWLQKYSKALRVPEMVLTFGFLASGIILLVQKGEITTLHIIKYALVFGAVPMAVVGFRKNVRALGLLSVVFLICAYGLAEMSKSRVQKKAVTGVVDDPANSNYIVLDHGKQVYLAYCTPCHGENGKKKLGDAPDLLVSVMTPEMIKTLLVEGKGQMPSYEKVLNEAEKDALVHYLFKLREVEKEEDPT